MIKEIQIADYKVGPGQPCFIIAEAGVNHNGDMRLARELIKAAVVVGADAIKFQSYVTEELVTLTAPQAPYQKLSVPSTQFQMLKALELSQQQQTELAAYCASLDIVFLSTPYDMPSVDLLDELGVAAFKLASADVTNTPLLCYAARKGCPIILSTGMSNLDDVSLGVSAMRASGFTDVCLLHCTSAYPAAIEEANLRAIATLERSFDCPVGFSDHTVGINASQWAVA
ncbi:MAG: N-acetylneuraminate synthase, partial [Tenericutes bacterium]